jgi:hypothetical protein
MPGRGLAAADGGSSGCHRQFRDHLVDPALAGLRGLGLRDPEHVTVLVAVGELLERPARAQVRP